MPIKSISSLYQAKSCFDAPGVGGGGGGPAATTWNSSDKTANMGLTGSNLIATASANAQAVRSIASVTASQKVYMEFTPTVNADNQQFGLSSLGHPIGDAPNADLDSIYCKFDGTCSGTSTVDTSGPTWTTGDSVGIAYDDGAKTFKWNVNGGTFSGDKAVSIVGSLYAFLYIQYDTEVTTARFASADWLHSAPSGYTQLA